MTKPAFICLSNSAACRARRLPDWRHVAAWVLGNDIDTILLLDHLVALELEATVGNAFPGLHVVLVAVPAADEVQLNVPEVEPARSIFRQDALLDLRDG